MLILALLVPAAAKADPLVVRTFLGVGAGLSDAGGGLTAQAGLRISPVFTRLTLDLGGGATGHGFIAAALQPGWLHPLTEDVALVAGMGIASVEYGFVFDDPSAHMTALTPEVALLFGHDRWLGKLLISARGYVPLNPLSHERDYTGRPIEQPIALVTAVLAL